VIKVRSESSALEGASTFFLSLTRTTPITKLLLTLPVAQ